MTILEIINNEILKKRGQDPETLARLKAEEEALAAKIIKSLPEHQGYDEGGFKKVNSQCAIIMKEKWAEQQLPRLFLICP